MEEELSFPNPVLRTDLPVKKPWWPKAVAVVAVVGLLSVIFLPQILHTRIGKRLMRARLESRYNAEITIQDFSTSWFGGTTAGQVWFKTADGRIVGFNTFTSEVSLWKLLRGKYPLGNCAVDGLIVDYVLDSGDDNHRDTYEKITGALPRKADSPPADLAKLSGKITLTNSQLNFYRGKTDPNTLSAIYQFVRFANIEGQFNMPGLDQPWTYKLNGSTGLTGDERGQTFDSAGTICLGEAGKLLPSKMSVDASFTGQGVPTDLVPVLLPLITADDCHTSFGPTFDRLKVTLKGSAGVLKLQIVEAASPRLQAHLQPVIDLNSNPPSLKINSSDPSDNLIAAAFPAGPARTAMACVNPLALYAGNGGTFVLRIESMDVQLGKFWPEGIAKAELELHDLKLSARRSTAGSESVRSLTAQLAVVSGDLNPSPAMQPMPIRFSLNGGSITLEPKTLTVGEAQITFSGSSTAEGLLHMKVGVSSPQLLANAGVPLEIPLGGTVESPTLDLDAAIRTLPVETAEKMKDWTRRQSVALQTRDADDSQRDKDKKVKDMLKAFVPETAPKP